MAKIIGEEFEKPIKKDFEDMIKRYEENIRKLTEREKELMWFAFAQGYLLE